MWKPANGKFKEQWGKLIEDDPDVINGRREQLEGKLQERYRYAEDQPGRISTSGTASEFSEGSLFRNQTDSS